MWERLAPDEATPTLHDPVLLVSVSTAAQQYSALYSQGRELATYMISKKSPRRFATLYSSALPPALIISDQGSARLISNSFYHLPGKRDMILFAGDASPVEEQYEYSQSVLSFSKQLGVKEVISVGARWTEPPLPASVRPKVLGFSTDADGVSFLGKLGVTMVKGEPAQYFSSLVVGLAEKHGMRGYKLEVDHGEPAPHPKSLMAILDVLKRMMELEVDTSELEERAATLEKEVGAESFPEMPRERTGIYG